MYIYIYIYVCVCVFVINNVHIYNSMYIKHKYIYICKYILIWYIYIYRVYIHICIYIYIYINISCVYIYIYNHMYNMQNLVCLGLLTYHTNPISFSSPTHPASPPSSPTECWLQKHHLVKHLRINHPFLRTYIPITICGYNILKCLLVLM